MQFTSIIENNFSRGEAAHTSENLVPEGYVEKLVNGDVLERRLRKRAGYQGYSGSLPFRVEQVRYVTDDSLTYVLNASINVLSQPSSPLVVYGRGSVTGTETDEGHYYTGYSAEIRKTLAEGTFTLDLPASDHGFTGTNQLLIGLAQSTSPTVLDYTRIYADTTEIEKSTADVEISYTNNTQDPISTILFYADAQPVAGQVYSQTGSTTAGTPTTVTVPAATHGLPSSNMLVRVYEDTGTHYREIRLDQVTIDAGEVELTFTPEVDLDYLIVLAATPALNVAEGTIGSGDTGSYTILGSSTPFQFIECYLEDPITEIRQRIEPDQITYDSATNQINIRFTNRSPDGLNYVICWTPGRVVANTITVERTHGVTPGTVDSAPQLTIWGFYHSEIYSTTAGSRAGWVNHIDSYRREADQRLVAGLGGNLYASRLASEISPDYQLGSLATRLRGRMSTTAVIGPAIYATNTAAGRSRGYLTIDGGAYHRTEVIGAEYVPLSISEVVYTLTMPSLQIRNSGNIPQTLTTANLAQVIQAGTDLLTISGMTYSRLNGEFEILGVNYAGPSSSGELVEIRVRNPNIDSADWDDPAPRASGLGGIYTDVLTLTATSPFLPGDTVESSSFPADIYSLQCVSSEGNTVTVRNVLDRFVASSGLRVTGRRSSPVVPLWDAAANSGSTTGIVRGDSLRYSADPGRLLQVRHVNAEPDRAVTSVIGDGYVGRVTLASPATNLAVGQSVILRGAGPFTGIIVISDIPSQTEFEFVSRTLATHGAATLVGYTVEVDEVLSWSDSYIAPNLLTVESRWIPVEAPESAGDIIPTTRTYHFDYSSYDEQPHLRSVLSSGNMYLTNGVDSVHTFDGSNLRQSGLPNWQAPIFAQLDTATPVIPISNLISTTTYKIKAGDNEAYRIEIPAAEALKYKVGDRIQIVNGTNVYRGVITNITTAGSTSENWIYYSLDNTNPAPPPLDAGATPLTVSTLVTYRYFAQLQAFDANGNRTVSAALGSANLTMEMSVAAGVELTFVVPPNLNNYDYSTWELRIFRTLANQVAPYYQVTTLPLRDYYQPGSPYITFRDSFSDDALGNIYELSTLTGIELPTQLRQAPLARYTTSLNNSLILANTTDQPLLNIRWETVEIGTDIANSDLAGTLVKFRRDDTLTGAINAESTLTNTAVYELVSAISATTLAYVSHTDETLTLSYTGLPLPALSTGNWIYLTSTVSGNNTSPIRGWWQVLDVPAAGQIVINYSGGNPGTLPTHMVVSPTNRNRVPVYLGTDDYNSDTLNWNSTISTRVRLTWRLASAINASMRVGAASDPWLVANAGGEYALGQILVRHLQTDLDTPEVEISCPAGRLGSIYNIFINNIDARDGSTDSTLTFSAARDPGGSRLYVSYPNFPEVFSSNNYIDVNAADGQDITGVIPFFGDSISSGSQREGFLLVFKSNSVYAVTISFVPDSQVGLVLTYTVTKLETNGLGCTAPYSIAVTKDGIMFANEAGIYRITRNQTMEYIGYFEERNWLQTVNRGRLDLAQGHHYAVGQRYKLSVPASGESSNSLVFTYSHTQESSDQVGAWSRYDNHPATGWANLGADAYFGSTLGRVFVVRRAGDRTDFRDDASPIQFEAILRATDFGDSGIRKVIGGITTHFRMPVDRTQPMDGTVLSTAADFLDQYIQTTPLELPRDITPTELDDQARQRLVFVQSSIKYRRITYIQVSYTNSSYDEDVEIAGITYRVSALSGRGILEAQQVTTRRK